MYVVLTGPEKKESLVKKIKSFGFNFFHFSTILFEKKSLSEEESNFLLGDFSWVIFTSKNGVRFFEEWDNIRDKKIGVVGKETAKELEKIGVKPDFMSPTFNAEDLGKEIPIKSGERALLFRSD